MIANVNEQLWIDFNLDTAVFLDSIAYWIKRNALNKKTHNYQEGQYWTYNSLDAFTKMFPGWSVDTIRRIIRNCVKHGLLKKGNFNLKGYDRTGWYSLTDKALKYYPNLSEIIYESPDNPSGDSFGGSTTSSGRSTTPIPKNLPSLSNINITNSENKKNKAIKNELIEQVVDAYHEVMPELPKFKSVDEKLKKQITNMIRNWPSYQSEGKDFTIESFKNYLLIVRSRYPWFLKPYQTQFGNTKKNSLRNLTRETTISKVVNGEYSA